jgi:tetratricopeptide (TPR) repeat protein
LEDALLYLVNIELPLSYLLQIQFISTALSGNKREAFNSINSLMDSEGITQRPLAGAWYLWLEEYDSAKLYLESALQSEDQNMFIPRFQACLALAYYKTNNDQQAQMIINKLIKINNETRAGSPDYCIGWYYSGIGKVDSAFYWLEKAYNNRSPEMPWLKVDPVFKNLKDDDRYWDLYERTGHRAYDEYMKEMKK